MRGGGETSRPRPRAKRAAGAARASLVAALLSALVACSAVTTRTWVAAGDPPLCPGARDLGRVAVVPETAWRADQKDVAERSAMAARAIAEAFDRLGCGADVRVEGFTPWSATLESAHLNDLAAADVETAVFVRVEELGPTLALTFSLPFLWVGTSEAQAGLRAVHLSSHRVLLDAHVYRSRGGPFQLRPAGWAERELVAALGTLLDGSPEP